jgi:hypothetical protein
VAFCSRGSHSARAGGEATRGEKGRGRTHEGCLPALLEDRRYQLPCLSSVLSLSLRTGRGGWSPPAPSPIPPRENGRRRCESRGQPGSGRPGRRDLPHQPPAAGCVAQPLSESHRVLPVLARSSPCLGGRTRTHGCGWPPLVGPGPTTTPRCSPNRHRARPWGCLALSSSGAAGAHPRRPSLRVWGRPPAGRSR